MKKTEFERCWIVGAGAIGSVLAAALKLANPIDVHLVGESPHALSVAENGLTLYTPSKEKRQIDLPVSSLQSVPGLNGVDLVVLINKLPAMEKIAGVLRSRLNDKTAVVALHNGIGVESYMQALLGRSVDRGLVFFGANSPQPGQVTYYSASGIRLRDSAVTRAFCNLLHGSLIPCEIPADFQAMVWKKLIINCVANSLAGILNISNKEIIRTVLDDAKSAIIDEVRAVAAAEGVELTTTVADMNRYLDSENTPSMVADLNRRQKTEIDFINGAIVRMAQQHSIPVPANRLIVSLVKYLEGR